MKLISMSAILSGVATLVTSVPALADAKVLSLHFFQMNVMTDWQGIDPLLIVGALAALGAVVVYRLNRAR